MFWLRNKKIDFIHKNSNPNNIKKLAIKNYVIKELKSLSRLEYYDIEILQKVKNFNPCPAEPGYILFRMLFLFCLI